MWPDAGVTAKWTVASAVRASWEVALSSAPPDLMMLGIQGQVVESVKHVEPDRYVTSPEPTLDPRNPISAGSLRESNPTPRTGTSARAGRKSAEKQARDPAEDHGASVWDGSQQGLIAWQLQQSAKGTVNKDG